MDEAKKDLDLDVKFTKKVEQLLSIARLLNLSETLEDKHTFYSTELSALGSLISGLANDLYSIKNEIIEDQ